MPIVAGLFAVAAFAVIYPFAHAHPMVIVYLLAAVLSVMVITLILIRAIGRRQVMSVTRPPARALPRARRMPEPVGRVPSWADPFAAISGRSFTAVPAPAPEPEMPQGKAEVVIPGVPDVTGTCEWLKCHGDIEGDAWELVIASLDAEPGEKPEKHRFCSRLCLEFYQNEDHRNRSGR